MVHSVPLDGEQAHCRLDVGATLTVPDELRLTLEDVRNRRSALDAAHFGIDLDRLDLCVEY